MSKIDVKPIKPHVGATVTVNRSALADKEVIGGILQALDDHGVLVFPRLDLDDEEQLTLTDNLGAMVDFTKAAPGSKGMRQGIYKVTLDPKQNDVPEYVLGTFFWHMDGMPVDTIPPPKASLLSARSLASKGGQTEFASTTAAYESLSPAEQAEFSKLQVRHSAYAGVRPGLDTVEDHAKWNKGTMQGTRPLVWTRSSGRKSFLIGNTADSVVGMSVPEGRALLMRLTELAAQPDFKYTHQWRKGDLVIWDNCAVLHRVIPYAVDSGRTMHRTSLANTQETLAHNLEAVA